MSMGTAQSTWTTRASGVTNDLSCVASSGSRVVVGGRGGTILTSTNGVSWALQNSGTASDINSIAWTGTQFVAVDFSGAVRTSVDGTTWTYRSSLPTSLYSVIWASNQLVTVGSDDVSRGLIATSPDNIAWTVRSSDSTLSLKSIVWTGTKFVAVGAATQISPDGVVWTSNGGTKSFLNSIAWTGNQLVAIIPDGNLTDPILTSPNGTSWTSRSTQKPFYLWSIIWTGTQLITVGNNGTILTSNNGISWSEITSGSSNFLLSVAVMNGQLVCVGTKGTILTSPLDPTSLDYFRDPKKISLRFHSSHLFATLPISFLGAPTNAILYTTTGNKLRAVRSRLGASEISLPLNGLSRGTYLFEILNPAGRVVTPFSLTR